MWSSCKYHNSSPYWSVVELLHQGLIVFFTTGNIDPAEAAETFSTTVRSSYWNVKSSFQCNSEHKGHHHPRPIERTLLNLLSKRNAAWKSIHADHDKFIHLVRAYHRVN